jgi:hypothetical protein
MLGPGPRRGAPLQILQHGRDEGSPARVFGGQRCRIETENIAGLLRGFLAVRCRGAGEVRFQLILAKAQGAFVGFHLGEQPTQIGCLLSFHSAALVKVDRLFRHGFRLLPAAALLPRH